MDMNFGKLVKKATNQMNKAMDEYAKAYDLTGMQLSVIDFIGNSDAVLQRDIEAQFGIQRSTVSVMLKRMEARGLVTRTDFDGDARQKAVGLTIKAQELHAVASAYIAAQQAQMTAAFTPAQQATFIEMLNYFIELNRTPK